MHGASPRSRSPSSSTCRDPRTRSHAPPTAPTAPTASLAPMRLLTWNIHKGIGGLDRRYAPRRIAAVIRHYDPDVVVLQEVDQGVPRSRLDRQLHLLGDELGYEHRAWGPNVTLKRGVYGNGTLSRFPIARSVNIDLTFPLKKARGACSRGASPSTTSCSRSR